MKDCKNLYASIVGWSLFLTGTFMFNSCVDEEIESGLQTTGKSIGFSASYSRNIWEPDQTRAAKDKTTQIHRCESSDGEFSVDISVKDGIHTSESQQMQSRGMQITQKGGWNYKVGAYYTTDQEATNLDSKTINFFSENTNGGGLSIASDADNYTTNYYWPPVGTMKFFAVAPADIAGVPTENGSSFAIPTLTNINAPTLAYTIPSEVANQMDIMVAQSSVDCNANNGTVGLQFEHLLAGVHFKMGDMIATQVNSITISGIKGGAVTFGYSDGKWAPTSYGETNASYALTLGTQDQEGNWEAGKLANTLNLDDAADITGNNNNSMLLIAPQTLSGAKVTVNYTEILVKDEEKGTDTKNTAKTIELPTLNLEAGKTYALTLNISSGLSIEIPQPNDQDAHFVMVNLEYDLSKIPSTVTNLKVSVTDFVYENEDDTDNHSTNEDAYVIRYDQRSETHKRGYWAKKDVLTENVYNSNGELTNTTTTENILLNNNNKSLALGNVKALLESANSIMLFLGENNSEYNRDIILRITGEYKEETITIGSGRFTQLCPSWNGKQYGCERIEDVIKNSEDIEEYAKYPFGFYWDKKATYTLASGLEALLGAFSRATFQNILKINLDEDSDETAVGVHGNANTDFLSYQIKEYKGLFINFKYISSVTFNYNALSTLTGLTDANNGLTNTVNLFEHVGSVNINDIETDLDNLVSNYTLRILGFSIPLISSSKSGENKDVKTIFAAGEALKCNEVIGKITKNTVGSNAPVYNYGFTLVNDSPDWYLPSSGEAKNLSDPVYPLDGVYWSSTAGDDTKKLASSYEYVDNELNTSYGESGVKTDEPRETPHQIRAVRKKPTPTN